LGAQGGNPADTTRGRPDTTHAGPDTTRGRSDTAGVAHRAPGDTTAADSTADSTHHHVSKADSSLRSYHPDTVTVRSPIARAENPPTVGVGRRYVWDRQAIFSSGALTLADLLATVPGFTGFSAGWISTPMVGSYLGDPARVRVFYDGVELDGLDPRLRNTIDLATIQLWTLEEVVVERGASELRVYLRSWRADHTTPETRLDLSTGNDQTNVFRGFYGQRFGGGEVLQVAAQNYTNIGTYGGGGSETSVLARLGWAHGPWSFDAFGLRYQRGRDMETRVDLSTEDTVGAGLPLPNLQSTRTDAYIRAGYGDPDAGGLWVQLIAASMSFQDHSVPVDSATALSEGLPVDLVDTNVSESQYIAAAGVNLLGIHLSATERLRVMDNVATSSPSARASIETGPLAISLFAEADAPSAWPTAASPERIFTVPVSTVEGAVRFTPLPFISLSATAGRQFSSSATDAPPTSTTLRGEAAIRVGRLWVGGGIMTRDTAIVQGLSVYDTTFVPAAEGRVTGRYATVHGPLWKIFSADMTAINWGSAGPYRPQYQFHGELSLNTEWLKRFPRHTFAIRMWGGFDYRSQTPFPTTQGTVDTQVEEAFSSGLEIRILQATVFWEDENINGYPYDVVPGYLMPRQLNIYGVRWSFWN
jgi:hypothetical protein